jgi:energy-coupling factor transporter ATP-binding protein EcfA2
MNEPATPAEAPVRITRLVIDELFGSGSPTIDIAFKLEQRVTVLHGRNGSGKTITLTLLEAIREGRFEVLAEYPFKRLRLELSDGDSLELEPRSHSEAAVSRWQLWRFAYSMRRTEAPVVPWSIIDPSEVKIPFLVRVGLKTTEHLLPYLRKQHPDLFAFLDRMPKNKFIKADRLFVREAQEEEDEGEDEDTESPQPELMVERLSHDIRQHIIDADRQYRLISTQLDSSLPKRLFADHGELPSLDELERRERSLREQAARLVSFGLLREQPDSLARSDLTEDQKKTFFIILKDREEKLEPFASVAAKAQRLLDSLNRKLAPKSVRLDVETGYQVFSANGTALPLRCLSSGEQHEFVLLHELLFDVQPGSLILIDEPELSLHVTWQADVLPDLLDIAKLADLDIVLATHSPYIVGDHEDLMVRLGEPV